MELRAASLVERELVGPAVDRQPAAADAVGVAADDGAHMRRVVEVAVEIVEAEDQRMRNAGEPNVADDSPEGDDLRREIARSDGNLVDPGAVRHPAEMPRYCHPRPSPPFRHT
jgi:hypothetical protein